MDSGPQGNVTFTRKVGKYLLIICTPTKIDCNVFVGKRSLSGEKNSVSLSVIAAQFNIGANGVFLSKRNIELH